MNHDDTGFQSSKSQAMQAAEDLRAAASTRARQFKSVAENHARQLRDATEERAEAWKRTAEDQAGQVREAADQTWGETQDKLNDLKSEMEHYVRENPTRAVIATFAAGFFFGMLLRR